MKISKLIAVSTALSLLFINNIYYPINAVDTINAEDLSENTLSSSDNIQILSENEVPAAIDYAEVVEKGHYDRLEEKEEALNTMVFANTDGTQSCYIFNYPVKYINENGDAVDKSMEIGKDKTSDNYVSSYSDISTSFGETLTDGVELSYEDINIEMIPDFVTNQTDSAELSTDNKSISYEINEDISLEYSLTYQGFKENIILDEYSGVNEFSFMLFTNGLELSSDESGAYNLYNESGEAAVNLGEIIVFDADGDTFIGDLSYEIITPYQEYTLTISVDEEFLTDSNTRYPVCIDPTLEINYDTYGTANGYYDDEPAIHHCTFYNDQTYSFGGTMVVGKCNNKVARTLMRFPILIDQNIENIVYNNPPIPLGFLSTEPERIVSAKVYLRDVGYQSDTNPIDIYCYKYILKWNEDIFYSDTHPEDINDEPDIWSYFGGVNTTDRDATPVDVKTICHSNGAALTPLHYYAFDITSIVKSWNESSRTADDAINGILFKASDEVENGDASLYCSFGSYNSGYYAPYLVIDYTDPYGYDYADDVSVNYTYHYQTQLTAGETYIFQTEQATNYSTCDTELYLFKADMSPGDNSWYNDNTTTRYSRIEAEIQTTGTYILVAKHKENLAVTGASRVRYCNVYQVDPDTQEKTLLKEDAQLGGYKLANTQTIQHGSTYNSFTTDLKTNGTRSCNPVMLILGVDSSGNRKVIGYNNDFGGASQFTWALRARVKQSYNNSESTPLCVYIYSQYETSTGTTDIYGFCKGTYGTSSDFPNLNENDGIISAPETESYNCMAFSGGITNQWINPQMTYMIPYDDDSSSYLTPWYNNDNVVALDNFYGNNPPRYAGATTYEVTTDENEAVVNVYKSGDEWTHAAVRNPANNQPHGYAWESKMGCGQRIFHPENALDSSLYGQIARRYKIAEDNMDTAIANYSLTEGTSNEITFEESIELGMTETLNIELSDYENQLLFHYVEFTDTDIISEFHTLYSNWIDKIESDNYLSIASNSLDFVNISEYTDLSEYIDNNTETIYIIIDKYLNESNIYNTILLTNKVVNMNSETITLANRIREENNEISINSINSDTYIAPSFETNALCFIKEYLNCEETALI